jgi:hypothetical protein
MRSSFHVGCTSINAAAAHIFVSMLALAQDRKVKDKALVARKTSSILFWSVIEMR